MINTPFEVNVDKNDRRHQSSALVCVAGECNMRSRVRLSQAEPHFEDFLTSVDAHMVSMLKKFIIPIGTVITLAQHGEDRAGLPDCGEVNQD